MTTLNTRLDEAIQQRNDLVAKKQRVEGRLEAARTTLSQVETECRGKGIDPDKLDETIEQLQTRYQALVEQLEGEVQAATVALAPYLKESSS
jgi:predicted nuclease with TOPRIM domain